MQMFVPFIMYGLRLFFVVKTESIYSVYKILSMTLHTSITNYTSLQSVVVWSSSVIELCLCNKKFKEEEEEEEEHGEF